jgi:alpha-L-fucosidase
MVAITTDATAQTNSALAAMKVLPPPVSPKTGEQPTVAAFENDTPAQRDARLAWWREAKFGMFIHWGLYSALAGSYDGKEIDNNGEWIMDRAMIPVAKYAAYAKEFNPTKFDATEWVRTAKKRRDEIHRHYGQAP